MQGRMAQGVLLLQCLVISGVGVFVTCFVMSPFDLAEAKFERGAPTALTFVAMVEAHQANKNRPFGEVCSETAPPRVPFSGLVRRTGNLQYPVPDCHRVAPKPMSSDGPSQF